MKIPYGSELIELKNGKINDKNPIPICPRHKETMELHKLPMKIKLLGIGTKTLDMEVWLCNGCNGLIG